MTVSTCQSAVAEVHHINISGNRIRPLDVSEKKSVYKTFKIYSSMFFRCINICKNVFTKNVNYVFILWQSDREKVFEKILS